MKGVKQRINVARQVSRVGSRYLWDRLTRPVVTDISQAPAAPNGVSTGWLTAALCGGTSVRVERFSAEPISRGSTLRTRLHLTYTGPADEIAALPSTVFVKSTSSFLTRLHVGATGAAGVEARFYREIQPTVGVRTPTGYFGVADRKTGRSILLLEDMARTRKVEFGDILTGYIDRVRAESLVDTLAATHGALLDSPRFGADLKWMVTSVRLQEGLNRLVDFERRSIVGFNRSADVMPTEIRPYRDRIHGFLMTSVQLDRTAALGLQHSDVHAGNWFIEDGRAMGLYDWAIIAKGQGTRDLAYALMSNLSVDDRRSWERELVDRYTEQVSTVSGVRQDPAQVWLSYRQQTMHGLCFWLYTIGSGTFQPNMQSSEVSKANIARMTQAVIDLDSFAALAQ